MTICNYALEEYTDPLLWGNFRGHIKEAQKGSLCHRTVHYFIAFVFDFVPILSQVASLFEKFLVERFSLQHQFKSLLGRTHAKPNPPLVGSASQKFNLPQTNKLKEDYIPLNGKETLAFNNVNSSKLDSINGISTRQDFLNNLNSSWWPFKPAKWSYQPVITSKSDFIPKFLVEHVIRNKKDLATGIKYVDGDMITPMEGAASSFVTSTCPILMSGDSIDSNGHGIASLNSLGRTVIYCNSSQPHFEKSGDDEVMMKVVEVTSNAVEGNSLPMDYRPLRNKYNRIKPISKKAFLEYEDALQKHMVYHLTSGHRLPALHEIQHNAMSRIQACNAIDELIAQPADGLDLVSCMKDTYVNINGRALSLEALFNIYVNQVRNKFSVFEKVLTQGYIYMFDHQSTSTHDLGLENIALLNRLQILALKHLKQKSEFTHLKAIAFNDLNDKKAIDLLKKVFADKTIMPKAEFFPNVHFAAPEPLASCALVIGSNSNAFGQNIQYEGPSSQEGVIGFYSNAAWQLKRDRKDLLNHLI